MRPIVLKLVLRNLERNLMQLRQEHGFTLAEMLVSLGMFAVLGMSFISFSTSALHTLSSEDRAALATQELRSAEQLMSSEYRMSSSISPYIVGTTSSVVTCTSALAVTATTVKFLVVQDETATSTSGIQPYYVGYKYDSATKQLLRGEIPGTSITNCTPPAGDPTSSTYAKVVAENVVQIDADGNGSIDSPFVVNGNAI